MVFPSRGCQTCKERRVKCDAIRPVCGQCRIKARACTWNPNYQAGLHFKSENAFAQGQRRRPRKVKERSPAQMALITQLPTHASPSLSYALSLPIDVQAFHYWVENFMFRLDDLPDIGHEYSNYVIFTWVRAQPGSSLHVSLFALSHAVFGRARRVSKAIEDADRAHAQSINKTSKDMRDMNEMSGEDIDQLLVATMLMGTYENIMYDHQSSTETLHSSGPDEVGSRFWKNVCHHKGAAGLLKLRREQGLPPNLPLDKVVRRQIIRVIILRGHTIPEWLSDGAGYGEDGPMLELDSLMVRTANLRAQSLALAKESALATDEQPLVDLATEAQELYDALVSWSQELPEDWKFSTLASPSIMNPAESDLFYNGPVHIFTTHGHGAIWLRYRAICLIVNSIRNRALSRLVESRLHGESVVAQQELCQKNIESTANDMCGSVPFFFNLPNDPAGTPGLKSIRLGRSIFNTDEDILPKMAIFLAWPLTVALNTDGVPDPQRQWLRYRLKIAASSLGDAVLESVAERAEFRF